MSIEAWLQPRSVNMNESITLAQIITSLNQDTHYLVDGDGTGYSIKQDVLSGYDGWLEELPRRWQVEHGSYEVELPMGGSVVAKLVPINPDDGPLDLLYVVDAGYNVDE
jgi:hypothetical protein